MVIKHPRSHHAFFYLLVNLDYQLLPCTHDVLDIPEPTQTHRNMQVRNRLHQNLLYARLPGDGEAIHERPTDWERAIGAISAVSENPPGPKNNG